MASEGKNSVLMLTRSRIYFFDGLRLLTLDLQPNIVRDLDVKDRDGLFNHITNFIEANKIVPSQIFFVLAESVCFSKELTVAGTSDLVRADEMSTEFIETIPFTSVVSKIYKTPALWKIVGSNQDLIDTIFEAFNSKGFGLSALIPISVFPDLAMSTDLTTTKAQAILNKKEIAVQNSMVGDSVVKDQSLVTTQTAVPKNKLLPYLAGVFILLIGILVFMVLRMRP